MIYNLIAAAGNEGIHLEMLRRYMPKINSDELDYILSQHGPDIYRDIIWATRIAESPPVQDRRRVIGWPIKRNGNVLKFPAKTSQQQP